MGVSRTTSEAESGGRGEGIVAEAQLDAEQAGILIGDGQVVLAVAVQVGREDAADAHR